MLLDTLKDVRENLGEKVRNPFAGTFIVTWVLHNWLLVYTILNFDPKTSLHEKTDFIDNYIKTTSTNTLLWGPVFIAFAAIILYLIFQNVSFALFTASSKWIRPYIYSKLDQNELVEKKDHVEVQNALKLEKNEREKAITDLTNAVNEKEKVSSELAKVQGQYKNLIISSTEATNLLHNSQAQVSELKDEVANLEQILQKSRVEITIPDKIEEIFSGHWTNTFMRPSGDMGSEEFIIIGNNYFIVEPQTGNEVPTFKIENVRIDKSDNMLYFVKVGVSDNRIYLENTLLFASKDRLVGYEKGGIKIQYTRNDDF